MSVTHIPVSMRRLVYERAKGCCEYCLIPDTFVLATHQVDHVIAEKHGGLTQADNLALSCVLCNKRKGSDLASVDPDTGKITPLFHPRHDRWSEHFRLDGAQIVPLTPAGRATVYLLQFNQGDRIVERELLLAIGLLIPSS